MNRRGRGLQGAEFNRFRLPDRAKPVRVDLPRPGLEVLPGGCGKFADLRLLERDSALRRRSCESGSDSYEPPRRAALRARVSGTQRERVAAPADECKIDVGRVDIDAAPLGQAMSVSQLVCDGFDLVEQCVAESRRVAVPSLAHGAHKLCVLVLQLVGSGAGAKFIAAGQRGARNAPVGEVPEIGRVSCPIWKGTPEGERHSGDGTAGVIVLARTHVIVRAPGSPSPAAGPRQVGRISLRVELAESNEDAGRRRLWCHHGPHTDGRCLWAARYSLRFVTGDSP